MHKYYSGTNLKEANALNDTIDSGTPFLTKPTVWWTDSYEKACSYARKHSKPAVVEVILDELPKNFKYYFSVREGKTLSENFRQWALPKDYLSNEFSCCVEEVIIHPL